MYMYVCFLFAIGYTISDMFYDAILAHNSIYAIARYIPSPVRLSVRRTGGSVKHGWS